jgi:hypothetical protein
MQAKKSDSAFKFVVRMTPAEAKTEVAPVHLHRALTPEDEESIGKSIQVMVEELGCMELKQKMWDIEIRKVELQHEMDGLDILKVEKQLAAYKEVILDLNQHHTAEVAQLHVKVRDGRQQLVVGSHTRICFVAA